MISNRPRWASATCAVLMGASALLWVAAGQPIPAGCSAFAGLFFLIEAWRKR